MDQATLTKLLESANNGDVTTSSLFDVNKIIQPLIPFMIILTVISAIVMVVYLIGLISKWRANKAMLDIRKLLIEMNERDKARTSVATPAATTTTLPLLADTTDQIDAPK